MELNAFQQWCFNSPLQPQVLEDVKAVLSKNINDGICNGCVTMKGLYFTFFLQSTKNVLSNTKKNIHLLLFFRFHVFTMFIYSTGEKRDNLGCLEEIWLR